MSPFTIDFPGTPTQFVAKASSAIQGKGGTFSGNASSGNFRISTAAGAVEGHYAITPPASDSQTPILITITHKPFIVSANMIQNAIRGFF